MPEIYAKGKIAISLDLKLLKKIDKIKSYPRWKGNRSELIEESLHEFLNIAKQEAKCIFCGCTDSKPCTGGCYWVIVDYKAGKGKYGVGVCSKCVFNIMQDPKNLKEVK